MTSRWHKATPTGVGVLASVAVLIALAGCAGTSDDDPDVEPPDADEPCIVGTWTLDVADYAAQSEGFVVGLGIPIEDFAMTGDGSITFTADGLVATDIDLTTTGTIVTPESSVPLNQRSAYTASGDWVAGAGADTVDLANWANVPDPSVVVDPAAPPIPSIDYTDVPTVSASCSATDLRLQGPDAPMSALWHR